MSLELAYKEDLFFALSAGMEKEQAQKETERIAENFKKCYAPEKPKIEPIVGNDTYRYFIDHLPNHFCAEFESRVDKYVDGKWKVFMKFGSWDSNKCKKLVNRLKAGGNTVIEF